MTPEASSGQSRTSVHRLFELQSDVDTSASLPKLQQQFEQRKDPVMIEAMKVTIQKALDGEDVSPLVMPIIRNVTPSSDKTLKKLLYLFWPLVNMHTPNGDFRPEHLLVCNSILQDLRHVNPFVVAFSLRCLATLPVEGILMHVVDAVLESVDHRDDAVREAAIVTLHSIHRAFPHLVPSAPREVASLVEKEQSGPVLRRCLAFLAELDVPILAEVFAAQADRLEAKARSMSGAGAADILLALTTAVIALVPYAASAEHPALQAPTLVGRLVDMAAAADTSAGRASVAGGPAAVLAAVASALPAVSSAPTAIKTAASCWQRLLGAAGTSAAAAWTALTHLTLLQQQYPAYLPFSELVELIAGALPSIDPTLRRRAVDVVAEALTQETAMTGLSLLLADLRISNEAACMATTEADVEADPSKPKQLTAAQKRVVEASQHTLRHLETFVRTYPVLLCASLADSAKLVELLVAAATKDGQPARVVFAATGILRGLLSLKDSAGGSPLTSSVLSALSRSLDAAKTPTFLRFALWAVGEHASAEESVHLFPSLLALVTLPLVAEHAHRPDMCPLPAVAARDAPVPVPGMTRAPAGVQINADGTYGASEAVCASDRTPLHALIASGSFFVATAYLTALARIFLTLHAAGAVDADIALCRLQAIQHACVILRHAEGLKPSSPDAMVQLDARTRVRIEAAIRALADPENAPDMSVPHPASETSHAPAAAACKRLVAADEPMRFRLLDGPAPAAGPSQELPAAEEALRTLSKTVQLSGHSERIYAEAVVTVQATTVIMDVLFVNRSSVTIEDVVLELSTTPGLKVVDKAKPVILGAHGSAHVRKVVRISSTEAGVIFGNVAYTSVNRKPVVNTASEIHLDVADFLKEDSGAAGVGSQEHFRSLWSGFEWENKLAVSVEGVPGADQRGLVPVMTPADCVALVAEATGLKPISGLPSDDTALLVCANLYGCSVFGDEALVNVSVELNPATGTLSGAVRVRTAQQGLAMSLGERIGRVVS
jgi:coatomer subunit beta